MPGRRPVGVRVKGMRNRGAAQTGWHRRGMGRARGYGGGAVAAPSSRGGRRPYARWTHESIRTELLAFVGERGDWPSPSEFASAGRSDLHYAVKSHGGVTHWADELGLQMEPAHGRRAYARWTHSSIHAELLAFVGDRPDWPRAPEFEAAGRGDLRHAVKDHGGATYWAGELGLRMEPVQDRRKYTEADALRDLKVVVAQYGFLPGDGRLRQDGRSRLASFVRKQPGGYDAFRLKHGLSGPPHRY